MVVFFYWNNDTDFNNIVGKPPEENLKLTIYATRLEACFTIAVLTLENPVNIFIFQNYYQF